MVSKFNDVGSFSHFLEQVPFGGTANWLLGNKSGVQHVGGLVEGLGTIGQVIHKDGYKLKNMGRLTEVAGDGLQWEDLDDLGRIGGDYLGNYLGQKLFGDGLGGRLASMAIGYAMGRMTQAVAAVVEHTATGLKGLAEGTAADSPEALKVKDDAIAREKANLEKDLNMGVVAGVSGAGVLATKAGLDAAGLSSDLVTQESIAKITDKSLLTKADPKLEKEFMKTHRAEMDAKIRSGEVPFMDNQAIREAGKAEFAEKYGQDASRLMTEKEYVSANLTQKSEIHFHGKHSGRFTDLNGENRDDMSAFLRQEYQTKLAMQAGNAELAAQGKEALSIEHYAAPAAKFEETYSLDGKSNMMPLKGASLEILQAEKGMTANVDMKEYRKTWIEQKVAASQGVAGVDEYKTLKERTAAANTEFDQRYDNVQLVRKATAEEYYAANRTQHIEQGAYMGDMAMPMHHNVENTSREKASLMASYERINGESEQEIAAALADPNAYEQQKHQEHVCAEEEKQLFAQQEAENLKASSTAGIANIDAEAFAKDVKTGFEMPKDSKIQDFASLDKNSDPNKIDTVREATVAQSFKEKNGIDFGAAEKDIDAQLADKGIPNKIFSEMAANFMESGELNIAALASNSTPNLKTGNKVPVVGA